MFDPTGMVVTATSTDGTSREVTTYTYEPSGALTTEDEKIVVSYEGVTADVSVSVVEKVVESIEITTQPTSTTYTVGDDFDPTGMVVTAYWNDDTSAEVDDYTYSPDGALTVEDTTITISYGGQTATVSITVSEDTVSEQ